MPRFDANLTLLFTEVPFLDRFARARRSGFGAVEFLFPYEYSVDAVRQAQREAGVEVVLLNSPAGDWGSGERGITAIPGREAEFREGFERAISYASALHCPRINCLAGIPGAGVDPDQADATMIANLRAVAPLAQRHGVTLLIEPINTWDIPGFFVWSPHHARKLIEAIGADNVAIQYDMYHGQRMQGDLTATFRLFEPWIGHIQIADNPGRHQPGTGEIYYPYIFQQLDQAGYDGYVGLEYVPDGTTEESLGWMRGGDQGGGL